MNLYACVHNSLLNFIDPLGLSETDECCRYSAYSMPMRPAPPSGGGYVDQFGNWHPTFCLSCHDNTPEANFYKNQSMLANMLDYKMILAEQGLYIGLTLGLGEIAEGMEIAAYMRNLPQMNRACGLAAEARVEKQLIAEGNTILGAHVGARTQAGLRFIDRLVKTPDGKMLAIEIKSGDAYRDTQQFLRDKLMSADGAMLVGRNAPPDLRGKTFIIGTIERRY